MSFTFDDFQRSAYTVGGSILKGYNARGTYYAAMGKRNCQGEFGPYFTDRDLHDLVAEGHELACHTFSHLNGRLTSFDSYRDDILRNQTAVETMLPGYRLRHFAYPFGAVALPAKKFLGRRFDSCRGIQSGIHTRRADLNLLCGNRLYSHQVEFGRVEALIRENQKVKGWLIFYTHDIEDKPSPYGCTPGYFEAVVRCAAASQARILTIGQALGASGSTKRSK